MASERPGETSVTVTLPDSLGDWLDEFAGDDETTREDVVLQLLTGYQQLESELADDSVTDESVEGSLAVLREQIEATLEESLKRDAEDAGLVTTEVLEPRLDDLETRLNTIEDQLEATPPADGTPADLPERVETIESDIATLESDIDEAKAEFQGLLDDVRKRVIQVKREADGKASADHHHEELSTTISDLQSKVSAISSDHEELRNRMDAGFENFEAILEYLTTSIDELSDRQTKLAQAIIETRRELRTLGARATSQKEAADLRETANRAGVTMATCEECDRKVDIRLLDRSECPHCAATFTELESSSGFFGKNTLITGKQPALEPGDTTDRDMPGYENEVQAIIESDSLATEPDISASESEAPNGGKDREDSSSDETESAADGQPNDERAEES